LEQEAQQGRHTPIVALTAHATEADRERCLQAGMDGYISKPFTQAILYREVARWLAADAEHPLGERVTEISARTQCLDLRTLGELRALDPSAAKSMVANFVKTYVEHTQLALQQLRDAVTRGDFAALEGEAHKLRSGSLTIGAARLGKMAGVLERAAQAGELARCESLLKEIDTEFRQAEVLLLAQTRLPSQAA
jgi:CheY-like chemotaxis protein